MMIRSRANDAETLARDSMPHEWVELIGSISLCGRRLRTQVAERLAGQDLNEPQLWLLWACRKVDEVGLSQSELARGLAVSAAHVSQLVEQLRRRGWLEGQRSSRDRRRQLWRLTAEGRLALDAALVRLAPWLRQLDEEPGSPSRQRLADLLERFVAATARADRDHPTETDPTSHPLQREVGR